MRYVHFCACFMRILCAFSGVEGVRQCYLGNVVWNSGFSIAGLIVRLLGEIIGKVGEGF